MKKKLITTALFCTFFLMSINCVTNAAQEEKGYISVNENISKEIAPNQAEITVIIETSDSSLKKATDTNKSVSAEVYSALKDAIGPSDYIKTSGFSAYPQFIYNKDNKKILDKYIASNSVIVKTKNVDIVPKIIDSAISKGATRVDNLQFSAIDYDSVCNDTISDLTKKSYVKATSIAKSINSQLAGVKAINATCTQDSAPRPMYAMMMKGAADSASSTPIESGKIKIYVNVDASYYVN